MKFLFVPAYTNRPSVCSTSYLVWQLIESLMAWRDDTYFYVTVPSNWLKDDTERQWLSRYDDRVTLLPLDTCSSDRVSELYMLRNSLRFLLNPWNMTCWDVDVVVTSCMPILKHMRVHSARQGTKKLPSHRMYVGLEEMPILPFRDTVPWFDELYPDTLMSYALADATLINNQWTKKALTPVLREVLSPAYQKRVLERVHEVVPVKLQRLGLREHGWDGKGDFNVTFVGRITGTRNFKEVAELFRKQFAYPIGKHKSQMKFLISTNTMSVNGEFGEMDFIDLQMNDRAKFHAFLKNAHVAVNLTSVEDFSLSTYETLMAGCPIIVYDEPWNAFLGESYPFRCKNQTEVYALLNAFAADYGQQYAKFRQWEASWWAAYVAGPKNVTTGERLVELVAEFEKKRAAAIAETGKSLEETVKGLPELDGRLDLQGYVGENTKMFWEVPDQFSLPLGKVPNTLMWKLVAERLGWKDTVLTGVMEKA